MKMTSISRNDAAEILGCCFWSEDGKYLSQIVKSVKFPILVKVIGGQYQNINTQNSSYLILTNLGIQKSLAAQCVKFKNNGKSNSGQPFGPIFSIPSSYEGHFEILSEDGKSIPTLTTIEDVAKQFPESILIREPIKLLPTPHFSSQTTVIERCKKFGGPDKTSRTVLPIGETLVLISEVKISSAKNKINKYLKCFDSMADIVYLNFNQKGKFSPIASSRGDAITGLHTSKNLLNKRMPMMVRLVNGLHPKAGINSKSSSFKFSPELRLFSTINEELIFAFPLIHNGKESLSNGIMPLPLNVPLKFQICSNMKDIQLNQNFYRIFEKFQNFIQESKNCIHIYDINLHKELRFDGKQWKSYTPPLFLNSSEITPTSQIAQQSNFNNRVSCRRDKLNQINDSSITNNLNFSNHLHSQSNNLSSETYQCESNHKKYTHETTIKKNHSLYEDSISYFGNKESNTEEAYEDIDEIYEIVRGTKPLPPQTYPTKSLIIKISPNTNKEENIKIPPDPPPIETIPTTKGRITRVMVGGNRSNDSSPLNTSSSTGSNQKDDQFKNGLGGVRRYLKRNINSSGSMNLESLVFGGASTGSGATRSNKGLSKKSPIFDFRYKSMNDINYSTNNNNFQLKSTSLESRATSSSSLGLRRVGSSSTGDSNSSRRASPLTFGLSSNTSAFHFISSSPTGSNTNQNCQISSKSNNNSSKFKLFRPKSLTSIHESNFRIDSSSRGINNDHKLMFWRQPLGNYSQPQNIIPKKPKSKLYL